MITMDATNRTKHPIAKEKNAHGHHAFSAKRLENAAPVTNPEGAIHPNKLKSRFFFRPGGVFDA